MTTAWFSVSDHDNVLVEYEQVMLLVHQHKENMPSSCYESMVLAQLQREEQAAHSSEPCQLSLELQSLLGELQQKVMLSCPHVWMRKARLLQCMTW